MSKTILLLILLSVSAMHGAQEEIDTYQELEIIDAKQLDLFVNKVVAYTAVTDYFMHGKNAFSLQHRNLYIDYSTDYSVCRYAFVLRDNGPLHDGWSIRTILKRCGWGTSRYIKKNDEGDSELIKSAKLRMRLITAEEKKELIKSVLSDDAKLPASWNKYEALQYLRC